nr:ABC transporter ATP-binding protein [Anaerolineae bacterium]
MNNQSPLMSVKDLTTRFHTEDGTVFAVNGISYDLFEGETIAVVGESGCGKSVHALSIMRLIPTPPGEIVRGEVTFQGRDLLKLPRDAMRHVRGTEIAMIFQDPMTSLNPVFTIGYQIAEPLREHLNMSKKAAEERVVELLDMVGISDAAERVKSYPHEFSGGMRQRAMIAMALSCMPKLLIADEPTTALDVTIQAQIVELVKRLRAELNMSIIWITHDLGIVAGLAERILVMYAGYIVETAPVKELYANPSHPYTLGLLRSLPRVDKGRAAGRRLIPIAGLPPDQIDPTNACPFAPRCQFAVERCLSENPSLKSIGPRHQIACWVNVHEAAPEVVR